MPNTDSSRSAQLIEKRNELKATVLSRKRKLCELYAVTTSSDPNPAPIYSDLQPPDSALAQYLARNDIESGRYFDESTLPPRPRVEWLPLSPPEDVDDLAHADDADFKTARSPSPKQFDRSRLVSPQDSSHRASSRQTPEDAIITQHADADLQNGSIPTPRSAVELDEVVRPQRDKFPPSSKAATPHSPPDSPTSQYVDAHTSKPDRLPPETIDAQEEDQEISQHDGDAIQVRQGSAPAPALAPNVETFEQLQHAGIRHSAAAHAQDRGTSLPPTGSPKNRRLGHKTSTRTSPRKTPERLLVAENAVQSHQGRPKRASVELDQAITQDDQASSKAHLNDNRDQTQTLDIDSTPREPLSNVENRYSVPKRRLEDDTDLALVPTTKRLKRTKPRKIIKLAKADRYIPAARYQRLAGGQDYRHPGGKKDYMHILFLKQALDSPLTFKTDLGSLLGATSKTLTTSDWEANLHEKNECAVVKRVYDWQQRSQWSLRQPKVCPEPAHPPGHWDHLLREAKWLQTDFREERKLKLSICQELAHWCKQWHDATNVQRAALQIKDDCSNVALGRDGERPALGMYERASSSDLISPAIGLPQANVDDTFDSDFDTGSILKQESLDSDLIERLPLFEPWKPRTPPEQDLSISADMQRTADIRQAIVADGTASSDEAPAPEIPPEDTGCAIFDPAWRQLRARVNANIAFKTPTSQMPPMGFYEHRRASQWTPEDDHQLKQYAKDFPSNWALISDRLSGRSQFTPSMNRRTPWECYERLLCMDGVFSDPTTRQYARQFSMTLDRIRARWQQNIQQTMQAQGMTQQLQHSPPRFPAPLKVERKMPSRRFACILDGARKIARKRENQENNRRQSQHENQAQGPRTIPQTKPEYTHTPQYWSNMKYEREEQAKRKQAQIRQQQAALFQAQQQSARQNNQSMHNNGASQRTGSRGTDAAQAAPTANGHLAVPGTTAHRSQASQSSMPMPAMVNQTAAGNALAAQLAMGSGRPQTGMPVQQRMAHGFPNGQQTPDQSIQQMMAAQQLRQQQAYQAQRQINQNHVGHSSPTMSNMNGLPNSGATNQFNGVNGDSLQSPRLPQGIPPGSNQTSPNLAHQLMAQFGGRPNQLSSGHVTVLDSLRHNIAQENPQLSADEVMNIATSQLKQTMQTQNSVNYAQNRALNAAAGVHQMPQQQQQQSRPPTQQSIQNTPQSPYPNTQQSPYLQNSMLANHMQGRSDSPGNPLQQQQNYTQSMQAQIAQQMRRNGVMSPTGGGGGGSNPASSPPMGSAIAPGMYSNGPARTPTPGQNPMRPPSSAMMDQRPGSANAMGMNAGSPRPMSSQGVQ